MNVLYVCTGNICRSPMAEGILNKLALDCGLDIQAFSAGTSAWGGPATNHAVRAVEELYDVDISNHESQALTPNLAEGADIIICMESHHLRQAHRTAPGKNVTTMKLFAYNDKHGRIDDPYGGDYNIYRNCAQEIYQCIIDSLDKLEG